MPADTTLTGIILLLVVPLTVWDAVSSLGAGFDNPFWALPLDDKLDRIVDRAGAWRRLGTAWIWFVGVMAAGLTAFTFLLAGTGPVALASAALGLFLVGAITFVVAAVSMTAGVERAAEIRRESGRTPEWLQPAWDANGRLERAFVIGANLAYVVWGVAILDSGFPAAWVGWVAIVSGVALASWAAVSDFWFQHMTLLTPIALGIALLLS